MPTQLRTITPETRALIDQAVAEGRVTRLPSVDAELLPSSGGKGERTVKFNPEHCGKGGRVARSRTLDEIDGWYFS